MKQTGMPWHTEDPPQNWRTTETLYRELEDRFAGRRGFLLDAAADSSVNQVSLAFDLGLWRRVKRCDVRARELADRHYSRQTVGARDFMANGRTLVLLTGDARAVWGVIENLDPKGGHRWRCSIFRNEGSVLSSLLVREATLRTYEYWRRHYGALPSVPLTTEIDPAEVRRKRDPGRCFRKAGWRFEREARGLIVLRAPDD